MYKYLRSDATDAERNRLARIKLRNVLIAGLVIRLLVLILIMYCESAYDIPPYYIADDEKYVNLSERYIDIAQSPIDISALNETKASKYLSPFWPYTVSVVGYIFKTALSIRVLNILLSCSCILLAYGITNDISGNKKTALTAARLYAFMPYSFMVCCFPIKDLYLSMGTFVVFWLYIRLQSRIKVRLIHWLAIIPLLVTMSETRGAISEFLLLMAGVYICVRFAKKKQYLRLLLSLLVIFVFFVLFGQSIVMSFSQKADDYFFVDREDSTIALVRIDSVAEIYKLPITYLFSQIMPLSTSWLDPIELDNFWGPVISRLNATSFPIAIGNFIYLLFCKKKNKVFYYTSFALYCAVIILSLGIYRHYYFLLPLTYINYAMYSEEKTVTTSNAVALGTIALAFAVFVMSIT